MVSVVITLGKLTPGSIVTPVSRHRSDHNYPLGEPRAIIQANQGPQEDIYILESNPSDSFYHHTIHRDEFESGQSRADEVKIWEDEVIPKLEEELAKAKIKLEHLKKFKSRADELAHAVKEIANNQADEIAIKSILLEFGLISQPVNNQQDKSPEVSNEFENSMRETDYRLASLTTTTEGRVSWDESRPIRPRPIR